MDEWTDGRLSFVVVVVVHFSNIQIFTVLYIKTDRVIIIVPSNHRLSRRNSLNMLKKIINFFEKLVLGLCTFLTFLLHDNNNTYRVYCAYTLFLFVWSVL